MGGPAQHHLALAVPLTADDAARTVSRKSALAGRADEERAISAIVQAATRGCGGVALVRGQPGVGKSALLRAVSLPDRVVGVRLDCRPGGVGESLLTATRAMRGGADLADWLPTAGPIVLIIDDLHWADLDSVRVLAGLAPRVRDLSIAIVASVRGHDVSDSIADVIGRLEVAGALTEVAVGPLTPSAALDLARRVGGPGSVLPSEVVGDVEVTAGNPLHLIDIWRARAADTRDDPTPAASAPAAAEARPLPAADDRTPRVVDLSPEVRRMLEIAALLGEAFSLRELCATLGQSITELLPAVHEALDKDVVRHADGSRLQFRTAGLRTRLLAGLPAAVRAELHREIGNALVRTSAPAAAIARHLCRASLHPADVEWVTSVADETAATDADLAVAVWVRLREAVADASDRTAAVDAGLAAALLASGQPRRAESVSRDALAARALPGAAASLRGTLATTLMRQARWPAVHALAETGAADASLTAAERAEHLAVAAVAAIAMGDAERAVEAVDRADRSTSIGSSTVRGRMLAVRGHLAHRAGRLREAESLLRGAVSALASHGPVSDPMAWVWLASALADLDRLDAADRVLDEAAAGCPGGPAAQVEILRARAGLRLDAGLIGAAVEILDSLSLGEAPLSDPEAVVVARRSLAALYQGGRGGTDRWVRRLEGDDPAARGCYGSSWIARAIAARRAIDADAAAERDALVAGWAGCRDRGLTIDLVVLGPHLAAAATTAGLTEQATDVAAAVADVAARNPHVVTIQAAASAASALAARDSEALVEAARMWRDSPRRLEAVQVAKRVAEELTRLGRPELAETVSAEATRAYMTRGVRLNAVRPDASPVEPIGPPRRRRARPASPGRESLTRTEQIVAEHVELGESNAEIAARLVLSRRTVETHVSNILAKLGMRSRSDLIIAAAGRGARSRDDYPR
jgi:DNA-binding NarL/FixJ family response regulator